MSVLCKGVHLLLLLPLPAHSTPTNNPYVSYGYDTTFSSYSDSVVTFCRLLTS
jgi:hypothetical protein